MKANSKKTELLTLPFRGWNAPEKWYTSLLIVPSRKMHDSGWAHIAVIGVEGDEATEIIAFPDDIHWPAQSSLTPPGTPLSDYGALRTDAYWPSGVLRLWSGIYEFSVDSPTSSVDIRIRRKPVGGSDA